MGRRVGPPPTGTTAGCGSYSYRCSLATDTLGNLWIVDTSGVTSMTTAGVVGTTYAPLTGSKLESGIVDVGNNVWLAVQTIGTETGASGIEELPQGGSAIVDVAVGGSPEPLPARHPASTARATCGLNRIIRTTPAAPG